MKHYVGIYDPETKELTVTEANKVAVRSQLRQFRPVAEDDSEDEVAPTPRNASRTALTEAFGTKKSKKAVAAMAENRLLARGDGSDPLSFAIHSSIQAGEDDELQSSQQDSIQSNKPLPPANTHAHDIREVYSLSSLVVPAGITTLESLPLGQWKKRIEDGKPAKSRSHFVSNRLQPLLQSRPPDDSEITTKTLLDTQIFVCRYLEFLVILYQRLAKINSHKRIPPLTTWDSGDIQPLTATFPLDTVQAIVDHFLPQQQPTTFAMTLLRTTILALALHIPPAGSTPANKTLILEPTDMSKDLAVDVDEILKLCRELGCKTSTMSDTDIKAWGLERLKNRRNEETGEVQKVPKVRVAKLKFPIEFPKISQGRRTRR